MYICCTITCTVLCRMFMGVDYIIVLCTLKYVNSCQFNGFIGMWAPVYGPTQSVIKYV
jgi:hypothetical protein